MISERDKQKRGELSLSINSGVYITQRMIETIQFSLQCFIYPSIYHLQQRSGVFINISETHNPSNQNISTSTNDLTEQCRF